MKQKGAGGRENAKKKEDPQSGGENTKSIKNENCQKLIIFEGFRQNGLQIRIQRNFLRIPTPVKIDFRHFFENDVPAGAKFLEYFVKGFP